MTSILRVRDHLTRDQPANLAWIIDQVKLSLTDGDVMQRILLNDGNDAQEWMEVTQVLLDNVAPFHPVRRAGINLMLRLAKLRNIGPQTVLTATGERLNAASWRAGGNADVHRGTYDNQQVVVKKVRDNIAPEKRKAMLITAMSEAIIWRQLTHPNILQFIGVDFAAWTDSREVNILSPRIGQILADFVFFPQPATSIRAPPQAPILAYNPVTHRMSLLTGIAEAIHYLHSLELVHGDLNTSNVFVSRDGQAIVADFGMTMHDKLSYDSYIPTEAPGGTPGWQAPERLQETGLLWLAPSVDIFAVGCVAYAILTGSPPWKGSPLAEHKVRDGNMPPIAPDEKSLPCNGPAPSAELRELIKRCWALKPEDRPNITAVRSTLLGHHTQ